MVSNVPVIETVSVLQKGEDAKDRVVSSLQIAVKQIQDYVSNHFPELAEDTHGGYRCPGLSENVHEVQQLCNCLDRALLHGLRQCQQGYWPFVKEFTHRNTIEFLQRIKSVTSNLKWSRIWLCLALNESSLESYFHSFMQNQRVVEKYYTRLSVLRDDQRMQLLLTLVAGLEHVLFNLSLDGSFWDCHSDHLNEKDIDAISGSSHESQETMISPVSQKSFQEGDSGVFDGGVEITDSTISENVITVENISSPVSGKPVPLAMQCGCTECENCDIFAAEERERISKILNEQPVNKSIVINNEKDIIEVIHTKVVRRKKTLPRKSECTSSESQTTSSSEDGLEQLTHSQEFEQSETEIINSNKVNRLSKSTTDSGLSLENQSSDNELIDDQKHKRLSFEISSFHRDLDFSFCVPKEADDGHPEAIQQENCIFSQDRVSVQPEESTQNWLEERGIPEGQEDPLVKCIPLQKYTERQPLLAGNDGQEEEEEEISIYDLSGKCANWTLENSRPKNESSELRPTDEHDNIVEQEVQALHETPPPKCDPVLKQIAEELSKADSLNNQDMSLKVDDSTHLYLVVKIFEHEGEHLYKIFPSTYGFTEGRQQPIFVLLSNQSLYLLKPGDTNEKFYKEAHIPFSNIAFISVGLNYQTFTVVNKKYLHYTVCTASEYLTRSIISSLEVAVRRLRPKQPLFSVSTDATLQMYALKKTLAMEMKCAASALEVHHYVLVQWEDYIGASINSPPSTPAGPQHQSFLMYRRKHSEGNKTASWQPGFFFLKGGVLYCSDDKDSKEINFFIQLCVPHCRGCRRLHLVNRPHAFEIILSNRESLQLAASDDYEASRWLQAFLETVSQSGHFIDKQRSRWTSCCLALVNEQLYTLHEDPNKKLFKLLGSANVCDLLAVYTDEDMPTGCILEFEIGEASRCSGEWILFFAAEIEKEKFLNGVCSKWTRAFQVELQICPIKDLSLREKCMQMAEELSSAEQRMQYMCCDVS